MITPLHSRVIVHFVQLLITIHLRQIRQCWWKYLCVYLYYHWERSAKLPLRQFSSVQFILRFQPQKWEKAKSKRRIK
jgi:hypothetical protein